MYSVYRSISSRMFVRSLEKIFWSTRKSAMACLIQNRSTSLEMQIISICNSKQDIKLLNASSLRNISYMVNVNATGIVQD